MTTYVYINGTSGSTNPTTKFYTTPQVPAPTTGAWNSLANAEADASIRARTDDLIFICVGSVGTVIMSTNLLCSSLTIEGNVSTAVWNDTESTSSQITNTIAAIEIFTPVSATIKNMQVSHTGGASNPYGIKFSQATGSGTNTVDGCKIRLVGTSLSGEGYAARQTTSGYTFIVKNSIAFQSGAPETSRQGFYALYSATCHAYNSIAYGFTSGAASAGFTGFDTVVNCVSFGNTVDFLSCDSVSYCASDDGTGSNGLSGLNWNNQFQWFIDGDFRVKPGSSLLNAGIGPGSNANIPTVDITGAARSGSTTSIGASNTDTSSITVTRYVNTASSGGDGTTNATSGANAAYSSLLAWNTAEATNLTTSQKLHIVYCEGGQDTLAQNTSINMGGWTTNELYYPTITTTNANRSTLGRLDTSKYHLYKIGSGIWADIIQYVKHTKVIGIQFYIRANSGANSTRQCLVANTTNDSALVAENCIFDCGGNNTVGGVGRPWNWTSSNSTYPNYFRNNLIIFDSSNDISAVIGTTQGSGINNTFIYNNTFIDKKNNAIVFAINNSNASVWKNNIFQGFLAHFTTGTGNIDGSDYNLTDLSSLAYGTNNTLNTILNFNPATSSYLLSSADAAVLSEGVGPAIDRYVPITDIFGNPRSGNTTSVGALNTLSLNYVKFDSRSYSLTLNPAVIIGVIESYNITLEPPPGYAIHNVTDISQASNPASIYYGLSVQVGNQFLYQTTTTTSNTVSINSSGIISISGDSSGQFYFYLFDNSWSEQQIGNNNVVLISIVDLDDQLTVAQANAVVSGVGLNLASGAQIRYGQRRVSMLSYSPSISPTFNVPNLTEFFNSGMPLGSVTFDLLRTV